MLQFLVNIVFFIYGFIKYLIYVLYVIHAHILALLIPPTDNIKLYFLYYDQVNRYFFN